MTRVSGSGPAKRGAQSHIMNKTAPRPRQRATGRPIPEIIDGTPLQLLVYGRMKELGEKQQGYPLTYAQVVARSGGAFSRAALGFIVNGKTRTLTEQTAKGLAKALEVPLTTLREAEEQSHTEWSLPAKVQRLDPRGWEELMRFADFLLGQQNGRGPSR